MHWFESESFWSDARTPPFYVGSESSGCLWSTRPTRGQRKPALPSHAL